MKHIHLIGIGGTGISSIARVLLEMGYTVSGSDRVLSPLALDLQTAGATVFAGHQAENIQGADLIVRSSAVPDTNPEVVAARAAGIPVLKRSDFLASLMEGKAGIAVAGTHGKTTTTAMIAWMLTRLERDPSYIIGGVQKNLHSNAHAGQGLEFVIEADEYDRMFLGLKPVLAVVTNVEHDHPDCFPTPLEYHQAFVDFIHLIQPGGTLLLCQDDQPAQSLAAEPLPAVTVLTYGTQSEADYRIRGIKPGKHGGLNFGVEFHTQRLANLDLQVPGEHNARNAAAALAVAHRLGLEPQHAAEALNEYLGTGRRFDILGEAGGITIIDDYAHHPTEIRATLAAARSRFPGQRIWVVWQPHTYSRTQTLLAEFAKSFADADHVIVTEVFASRETVQTFTAARVVARMEQPGVRFMPFFDEIVIYLREHLQSGDVLLVLSAGDADQISAQVLSALEGREIQ
jgi:UDP-N-acetylmuramate--alanine ligase